MSSILEFGYEILVLGFRLRHEVLVLHSFRPHFTQLMTLGPGRLRVGYWRDVGVKSSTSSLET